MDTFGGASEVPSMVEIVPVEAREVREKSEDAGEDGGHNGGELQLKPQSLPTYVPTGSQLLVPIGATTNASVVIERQATGDHHGGETSADSVTLPSHIAIPIGLAQIFVGVSMVICGVLALRYQSYLFYYGSGLWAGTVAGIAGILGVTATKQGLPKPKWLCGGRKWQIHIFLAAVMVALSSAIVAAIFSTSGLVRDTQYDYSKDITDMTPDEETFEKRKSSGILINALLLLLSLLQILLSFCSLGIALRVLCSKPYGRALLSPGSADGSEITAREIYEAGPEYYEARKDRLLRWLGHQRRAYSTATHPRSILAKNSLMSANSVYSHKVAENNRLYPRFVALQQRSYLQAPPPPQSLPFVIPAPISAPLQRNIIIQPGPLSLPMPLPPPPPYHAYPQPLIVPIVPLPVRQPRSVTPVSVATSGSRGMKSRRRRGGGGYAASSVASSFGGRSKRSCASVPASTRSSRHHSGESSRSSKAQKNAEVVEITEEELNKTYTGLDRAIAEEFISQTMNRPN